MFCRELFRSDSPLSYCSMKNIVVAKPKIPITCVVAFCGILIFSQTVIAAEEEKKTSQSGRCFVVGGNIKICPFFDPRTKKERVGFDTDDSKKSKEEEHQEEE